jgi:hypothetical protein
MDTNSSGPTRLRAKEASSRSDGFHPPQSTGQGTTLQRIGKSPKQQIPRDRFDTVTFEISTKSNRFEQWRAQLRRVVTDLLLSSPDGVGRSEVPMGKRFRAQVEHTRRYRGFVSKA